MLSRWKIVSLVIMACLTAATALSQVSTATITGVVEDSAGAVIPGAKVLVTQTQTNTTAETTSDDRGAFLLPALSIGPYTMKVTAAGFGDYLQTNIVLTVGQVATLNVPLTVGNAKLQSDMPTTTVDRLHIRIALRAVWT